MRINFFKIFLIGKKPRTKKFITSVFFLFSFFFFQEINAQCAMCRAVLETEEGGVKAEAVNDGIVYLMAFPYLLVAIVGYIIYRSRRKKSTA